MKNVLIAIIAIGVVAMGLVSLLRVQPVGIDTKQSKQTNMARPADNNSVVIQNYAFSPNPLKVKKGTTVTWTNNDIAKHNVVVDDGQPAGGPSGPLFGKNETYQFTFANAGTFNYHCSPHPYMKGVVEVTE